MDPKDGSNLAVDKVERFAGSFVNELQIVVELREVYRVIEIIEPGVPSTEQHAQMPVVS